MSAELSTVQLRAAFSITPVSAAQSGRAVIFLTYPAALKMRQSYILCRFIYYTVNKRGKGAKLIEYLKRHQLVSKVLPPVPFHSVTQTSNAHAHTSDGCALCMRIRWGTTRYEPKDKVILGEGKGWLAKILKPHLNFISCCAPVSNKIFVDVCFLVRSSVFEEEKNAVLSRCPHRSFNYMNAEGLHLSNQEYSVL